MELKEIARSDMSVRSWSVMGFASMLTGHNSWELASAIFGRSHTILKCGFKIPELSFRRDGML